MKLSTFRVPLSVKFLISIALPLLAGAIGSYFTTPAVTAWYKLLTKPPLVPPDWVFGVVWNILFILMGIALFLVWKKGWNKPQVKVAVKVFIIQLVLNIVWSIVFFGLQRIDAGLIEIISLWFVILATIMVFHRVSRPAAWLLVPYIAWVSFAGYLNYAIWALN
jgi:tryptophan-rich sensory protein